MREMCPVCQTKGDENRRVRTDILFVPGKTIAIWSVTCPRCGAYRIHQSAADHLELGVRERVSGFLRHCTIVGAGRPLVWHERPDLTPEELQSESFKNSIGIEEILSQTPSTVAGKLDAMLVSLSTLTRPGELRELTEFDTSLAYTSAVDELIYYRHQLQVAGLLTSNTDNRAQLTSLGWTRADDLKRGRIASRRAFVAMWFDETMLDVYKTAIRPAIEATGYEPRQVAFVENNDDINDRVLAEIRGARFVVADFTGNRHGVYLEAGFALGLGRVVIWTVHKNSLRKLHFDSRNRSHIVWSTPAELEERLRFRILATVPAL